jgi:rSAM/selenodomain-associated transferase 1
MQKNKNLLLIFIRNPEPGKVKKRLAASIGDEPALEIYKFLLRHTHEITKDLPADKEVYYSEKIEKEDLWDESFSKKLQQGEDLGEKMKNAFQNGFESGYRNIIIIGSDLYDLENMDLQKAFNTLEISDYVIGPAIDGGYYLLGMKSLNLKLFKNKSWSTASVFKDTIKDLNSENITILEKRNDIDVFEDIKNIPVFQQFIK